MSISALAQNSIFVLISFFCAGRMSAVQKFACVYLRNYYLLVSLDIETAHLFQKQRVLDKPLVLTRKD